MANTDNKINIGDAWKDITEGYINIGDAWKQFWAAGEAPSTSYEVVFLPDGSLLYLLPDMHDGVTGEWEE